MIVSWASHFTSLSRTLSGCKESIGQLSVEYVLSLGLTCISLNSGSIGAFGVQWQSYGYRRNREGRERDREAAGIPVVCGCARRSLKSRISFSWSTVVQLRGADSDPSWHKWVTVLKG